MKEKASTRIINAVIFGGNDSFTPEGKLIPKRHPLFKSPCLVCAAMVCEKDMQLHMEVEHPDEPDRDNADNEGGPHPDLEREEFDEEDRPQSEGEVFRSKS